MATEKDRPDFGPMGQKLDVHGRCVDCGERPREPGVSVPSCLCPPGKLFDPVKLAAYIVDWFARRNGGEHREAIESMRVSDYRLMHDELEMILVHKGKPPNWV